jgi:hypothetical protein
VSLDKILSILVVWKRQTTRTLPDREKNARERLGRSVFPLLVSGEGGGGKRAEEE